jgi:dienelactone hydrolase
VAAIALALVGLLAGNVLGFNPVAGPLQHLLRARAALSGTLAFMRLMRMASDGYDVREARARWSNALKAYEAGSYGRAIPLVGDVREALDGSVKAGYRIYYRSTGGVTVSGLVFEPSRGSGSWPTVVVNHPGFGAAAGFSDVALKFRDRGYCVFCPDFRGSGKSEGEHELAKGEIDDVIEGLEYLQARGVVDGERVALCGLSHGASIALIAAGRYPGARAVVAQAGFSDLAAAYRYHLTHESKIRNLLLRYWSVVGGTLEERPEEYAVRSAVNYADSIQAPVLLIHGENDEIVPVDQAREMYDALRKAGKTAELKIFPGQGHGVTGSEAREEVWRLTFEWLDRYMPPVPPTSSGQAGEEPDGSTDVESLGRI